VRSLWPFRAGGPKECCHGWSAGWRSRTTRNPWNGVPRTPSPEWAAEMDRMKNSVQQKVPLAKTDNRWLTQRLAEERALRNPCEFVRIRAVSCELVRGRANLCEFVRISAESWVAVRDGAAGLPVGARPWGWRGGWVCCVGGWCTAARRGPGSRAGRRAVPGAGAETGGRNALAPPREANRRDEPRGSASCGVGQSGFSRKRAYPGMWNQLSHMSGGLSLRTLPSKRAD